MRLERSVLNHVVPPSAPAVMLDRAIIIMQVQQCIVAGQEWGLK